MKRIQIHKIRRSMVTIAAAVAVNAVVAVLPAHADLQAGYAVDDLKIPNTPSVQIGSVFTPGLKDATLSLAVSASETEPLAWISQGALGCAEGYSPLASLNISKGSQNVLVSWELRGSLRKSDGTYEQIVSADSFPVSGTAGEDAVVPICFEAPDYTESLNLPNTPGLSIGGIYTPGLKDAVLTLSVFTAAKAPLAWVSPGAIGCSEGFEGLATLNVAEGGQQITVGYVVTGLLRHADGTYEQVSEGNSIPVTASQGENQTLPICVDLG